MESMILPLTQEPKVLLAYLISLINSLALFLEQNAQIIFLLCPANCSLLHNTYTDTIRPMIRFHIPLRTPIRLNDTSFTMIFICGSRLLLSQPFNSSEQVLSILLAKSSMSLLMDKVESIHFSRLLTQIGNCKTILWILDIISFNTMEKKIYSRYMNKNRVNNTASPRIRFLVFEKPVLILHF